MKAGDWIIVRAWYCEVDGMTGQLLHYDETQKVWMVSLSNFREWPFEEAELEVITRG